MEDKVTIGIPTYNGYQRVENLLLNLQQRTPKDIPHEIVVCDDSGRPDHRAKVEKICAKYGARFIYHEVNRGVPTAWNTLTKSNNSEYVILLNDDILVADQWLKFPWHALRSNPTVGSFGLHCYFITASDVPALLQGPTAKVIPLNVRWVGDKLIKDERFESIPVEEGGTPGRVMCPTGCAFGFRKSVWNLVGGFDERYKAFYEETDFGVSCAYYGLPSYQLCFPGNYHIWSQTFASAPEINASAILNDSRRKFVEKWSARLNIRFSDAPELHNLLMDKIPSMEIKWLNEHHLEQCATL